MKLVEDSISIDELRKMSMRIFGGLVKVVVDVEKEVMVVDAEMHADEEKYLLDNGSKQDDLWGINLYPDLKEDFIEFDSMINIRPRLNNLSRGIEDENLRKRITVIVHKLVKNE
ncbi:hypothetical protein C4577_00315 [Candidatus Parcubacteria bacterium]|nr:MAG: hypothetical protein C4577_00315 [Candidatus Parcubacteria bacterium]